MKLHCKKLGRGSPIIILHGFLGTSDNWITMARALENEFTVYLLDQRNHGLSPHDSVHTIRALAQDLDEFVQMESIDSPVIIGHSMGGKVAMMYATMFENYKLLILVDIAPKYYPAHHQEIFKGLNSIDLNQVRSREDADRQLALVIKDDGVRQFLLKNLARKQNAFVWKANLPVLEKAMEHIGEEVPHVVVDHPVYFIRGEKSEYVQREDRKLIKTLYPQSKILTIKNAGHWVHAEQPEAFYTTISEVLKANDLL